MNGDDTRLAFNRGVISRLALARLDLKRPKLSAEEQTNWMARATGQMSLRPGLRFVGSLEPVITYLVLTTTPYALVLTEQIDASGEPGGGNLWGFIDFTDVDGAIVSGELRQIMVTYSQWPPETMDVDGSIQSGELRTLLWRGYFGPESIDVDGTIQSGELLNKLVSYLNWTPEAVDVDGTIISGTLT